ncbi:hypothetical protein EX895_002990 [Sporisorium graminicola]|uniref:Uncharacterized protein n=1 Tax=Sporisorium graminicola TaxID=280036 RepID=A0A4V6EU30_9BASI|nr:hypothetical protein EX895_002985 [Sporisorium graminicola]XP_029739879.1 hypothetical protein EX895_002990 [Sporisorium graminicola]TKY87889.1 hypothetical protein EX895_002985 [Sporisorium graminicola]TKY87894.1 hypothetical protein EX895_002990 [Sporisorium graminicola]
MQPSEFTGNLGPWARQLDWHVYWAGKPVGEIGELRGPPPSVQMGQQRDPHPWKGGHGYICQWIFLVCRQVAALWMHNLLRAGRTTQQVFHAHGPDVSKPYSLSDNTVRRRADLWAFLVALLVHVWFDGDALGYYGSNEPWDHHGVDEEIAEALLEIRDYYNDSEAVVEGDSHPLVTAEGTRLLLQLSVCLVQQRPAQFGHTEELALSRLFLHLCVSSDGTLKPVSAATSDMAALQFCFRAVLHEHLLGEENGVFFTLSLGTTVEAISAEVKKYVHHDSHSASAYLQSLHCYGTVLAQEDGGAMAFHWSKDLSKISFGLVEMAVDQLQALMHGAQKQAAKLLAELRLVGA